MVTVAELGILRSVERSDGGAVIATITPTYSGCPAMAEIAAGIRHRLEAAGYPGSTVRTQLAPGWTSDWITEAGAHKLREAGIAPPGPVTRRPGPTPLTLVRQSPVVPCPRCGSHRTACTSQFGSTACKALYRCTDCDEPFEYVKEI